MMMRVKAVIPKTIEGSTVRTVISATIWKDSE